MAVNPMFDWIYSDRLLICNGKTYRFKPQQADIINLLLIAGGRVTVRDLFEMLHPEIEFNPTYGWLLATRIKKINRVFEAVGLKIKALGQQRWIDCGVVT